MEVRFTMLGNSLRSIARVAYCVSTMRASTFTFSISRICSTEVMPMSPCRRTPALFTRTSSRPCSRRIDATTSRENAWSLMSPRSTRAGRSGVLTSAATVSTLSLRAQRTRVAPSLANARATAAPMPRLAPVTRLTRPSSSIEAHSEAGQDLASPGDGAHAQDVVRIEHDIEVGLELDDQGHVSDRVPLLEAVVGEIVGDPLLRNPERPTEAVPELVCVHPGSPYLRGSCEQERAPCTSGDGQLAGSGTHVPRPGLPGEPIADGRSHV